MDESGSRLLVSGGIGLACFVPYWLRRVLTGQRAGRAGARNRVTTDCSPARYVPVCGWLPLLLVACFTTASHAQADRQPLARQGVLDLRNVDFSTSDATLSGDWKFYWKQLRTPGQRESAFEYSPFPQLWSAARWQQQPIPSQGYATYGLTILLPARSPALLLDIPDQYSSYRLFVNGKDVAHDGHPATTAAATVPHWSNQLVALPESADTLRLLLQVANFHHAKGGTRQAIRLGQASVLQLDRITNQALDLLLAGCLFMGGLFFLGFFGLGRTERPMLYFSIFCLAYCYRILGSDQYVLHSILPDLPWQLTIRLEYISLYLAVGIYVVYTQALYPGDTNPYITNLMAAICFICAGTALVLSPILFTQLMNPFLILMVSYIGYATYVYWLAARRKRSGATYSLLATGFLMVAFALLILQYFGLYSPPKALLFAIYLSFFFLQALVLPFRFAFALREARRTEKQFLANMSHEIRTPLNAIMGFSNLLETTPLSKEQQEFVRYIHTAGKNLLTIVNDILDVAKIEAGMVTLETTPFSIRPLVDSIRTMLMPAANDKSLQLSVTIDPTLPPVLLGDPTRLTQILLNLLSNAIKFTQQGAVTVRITKRDQTADSVRVCIEVNDTGIGMSDDALPHIFTRFRQANDSTTRHYGGSGLGLSIVKSLTELQGGTVSVASTPGQGSCFTVEITYRIETNTAVQPVDTTPMRWGTDGHALRILVVEDNLINQKLAKGVLTRLGYTVLVAENGQEAIDLLTPVDAAIDIILMDIQMPVMDGFTATHHIRHTMHLKTPIIAMTAHALASEREQCLQAGMNDFISKPFQPRALQQLILKHVRNAPAPDADRSPVAAPPRQPAPGFSFEQLVESVDNDSELALNLLKLFSSQTPDQILQMQQALAAAEGAVIKRLVHLQKATIQLLNLTEARQLIQSIEAKFAADAPFADVAPLVSQYLLLLEIELRTIDDFLTTKHDPAPAD
ncbi:ATP-binding protein [Spirosoma rigui]|uniref:ATP-binding protein n=1 Tax=Spirosoma rigui TaxID=564064 RepID=UPI0009AFDDF0|nr:ATP-binding protein [Spirosoma rigui]